ncbi:MAG TPA: DNA-3-methyladenine glycosylase [Candidatus Saccharimonadales bacterium]|nr:DNA-3-methyladenine glycosylase [Candidatus Saccharimonadales bacterium]
MNLKTASIVKLPSLAAAPLLLGWHLCRQTPDGTIKLKIVETEAYHQDDPASHSYRGNTGRTWPMFEAGGHLYVYFTYGMHYALNIVTGAKGVGEGVLVRAGEPVSGIDIMIKNRGTQVTKNLASGPGKLAQALGIRDTKLSGQPLGKTAIWLEPPKEPIKKADIVIGPRVGVSRAAEALARFYIRANPYVSKL